MRRAAVAVLLLVAMPVRAEEGLALATSSGELAIVEPEALAHADVYGPEGDRTALHSGEFGLCVGLLLGGSLGCGVATSASMLMRTPDGKAPETLSPEQQTQYRTAYRTQMTRRRVAATFAGGTAAAIISAVALAVVQAALPPPKPARNPLDNPFR